jgi:hypothetical protein
MTKSKRAGIWTAILSVFIIAAMLAILSASVAADNCPDPAGFCARGLFDISDYDFSICHQASCMCPDLDLDSVCDDVDNCKPKIDCPADYTKCYNPDQKDTGGDPAKGDACDVASLCVVPYDDMTITQNTILCRDTYNVVDANEDGVIKFGAGNIMLDCNGAVLISSEQCNLPGDVNRNGVIDMEDAFYINDSLSFAIKLNLVYSTCIASNLIIQQCLDEINNINCAVDYQSYGYLSEQECLDAKPQLISDCGIINDCGPVPKSEIFDSCMDSNSDGIVNFNDAKLIDDNMVCNLKGDLDMSGKLDYMDQYLVKFMVRNKFDNLCGDLNNDGQVEFLDIDAVNTQISSESERLCIGCLDPSGAGGGFCNFACNPSCNCHPQCKRNGQIQLLGDMDYDGKITARDQFLVFLVIKGQLNYANELDNCLDMGDGYFGSQEFSYTQSIIKKQTSIFTSPDTIIFQSYPTILCSINGDISGNGYLDGLDIFLLTKMLNSETSSSISHDCADVNNDLKVDINDLTLLKNKITGLKGVGVEIKGFSNVKVTNGTFIGYAHGVNITDSGGSIISRNVFNTTSYGVKIN